MPTPGGSARDALRFSALVEACQARVLAYALRRSDSFADAEDVAAETFAVAWRRRDSLPQSMDPSTPADALPWLLGVARRVLANQRRGQRRRLALTWRVGADVATPRHSLVTRLGEDADSPTMTALRRLAPADQELLRLVAWEELDHAQIAVMLDISPNAVAIRLHRARRRFRAILAAAGALPAEVMDTSQVALKESGSSRTSNVVKGPVEGGAGRSG